MGSVIKGGSAPMPAKNVVPARLAAFIKHYVGQQGVGDTPINRGQCVGLVEQWIDANGLPHVWGNAKDLLAYAPLASYKVVRNTPTNYPEPGDIVCWGDTWGGGYGHTGICVTAVVMEMTVFEQNDPEGSSPHIKVYSYSGVLGWLHPLVKS